MYHIISNSKTGYGVKIIAVDSESDLKTVPIGTYAAGSRAFVIENSKTYMLSGAKKWVEVSTSSGSNSNTNGSSSGSGSSESGDSESGSDSGGSENPGTDYTVVDGGTAAG